MEWSAEQYLKFADERTRPARDLAAQVTIEPATALDLGCGPGNSTRVVAERFPAARVTGADQDANMLARARRDLPDVRFMACSLPEGLDALGTYDLVFSNACLHWVPNHERLFPRLMGLLNPGGRLAVQMPMIAEQRMYREVLWPIARSPRWAARLEPVTHATHALAPLAYHDILAACSTGYQVWETIYHHRLPSAEAIVGWYEGSGLRPYLQALASDAERADLRAELLEAVRHAFTPQASGEYVLEFPRLFLVAAK